VTSPLLAPVNRLPRPSHTVELSVSVRFLWLFRMLGVGYFVTSSTQTIHSVECGLGSA
jgi:hypothetical protein